MVEDRLKVAVERIAEALGGDIALPPVASLAQAVASAGPEHLIEVAGRVAKADYQGAVAALEERLSQAGYAQVQAVLYLLVGNAHYKWALSEIDSEQFEDHLRHLDVAVTQYGRTVVLAEGAGEKDVQVTGLSNRGLALRHLRRYPEAVDDFSRLLELRPDEPDAFTLRGLSLTALSRYEESLDDFNRSLELRADDVETINMRGLTLAALGRYDEALVDFSRVSELHPDEPDSLTSQGLVLAHMGRHEDALAAYSRAVEMAPDDADTITNRGIALANLQRFKEAVGDYDRSLKLRPGDADTHFNRGVALLQIDRFQEAAAAARKAAGAFREQGRADDVSDAEQLEEAAERAEKEKRGGG